MAKARKVDPMFDSLLFNTPIQRVLKMLLTESTTAYTIRVLTSKVKGVRGVGGGEGLTEILADLETLGVVEFINNRREVRLVNEHYLVPHLKRLSAICDLEGIRQLVEPMSRRGVLFGSRASGRSRTDSDYDLFVVTDRADEVRRTVEQHPMGRKVEVVAWSEADFDGIEQKDPALARKLEAGVPLWGPMW